ncbi:hypothetical protein NEOLI_002354 [Neolecta irregularis DAH-3]|uniref:Uncharacterized protein n=1 Tax=Neolecta irregularis (strain DAH-3) TaxID=1198029 RepID=A0A1U7LVD0_NEOID|nr:hypothetical protein NEOLI_002354 [Neolecta irregularis DAH-3]|eukprot:OLL26471.1 hypothetical protein NEOLI_002354 [Neolecta irregularis DAH-3]
MGNNITDKRRPLMKQTTCTFSENSNRKYIASASPFESLPTELLLNILCRSSNHLLPLVSRTIYTRLSSPPEFAKVQFLRSLHRNWPVFLQYGLRRRFFTAKTLVYIENWLIKQKIIDKLSLEKIIIPGSLVLAGKEDLLLSLYFKGARIEKLDFEMILNDVIRLGRVSLLRALINAKADFRAENLYDEALVAAVDVDDEEICDVLIANGALVANNKQLIGIATRNESKRMVRYLLAKGAIPDLKSLMSLPI